MSNGFDALDLLRREPADLAIIDLSMPGMGGLELLRRVKAEFPAVSVLVLSMHAEDQYAVRAFKGGAHGYITKDRAAAELVAAVHARPPPAMPTSARLRRTHRAADGAQRYPALPQQVVRP